MTTWECTGCGLTRVSQTKPEGWNSVLLHLPQDARGTDRICALHFCENQRCLATTHRIVSKLGIGNSLVTE